MGGFPWLYFHVLSNVWERYDCAVNYCISYGA
jgi:hypothetical protein